VTLALDSGSEDRARAGEDDRFGAGLQVDETVPFRRSELSCVPAWPFCLVSVRDDVVHPRIVTPLGLPLCPGLATAIAPHQQSVRRVPAMSSGCLRRRKIRRTNSKDGHHGGFCDHATDGVTSGERYEPRR
jgi:hypothetical protein